MSPETRAFMGSRERVACALAHRQPDRVPLDLGGTVLSGMHVSSVYKLRQALGLDSPGTPVKVIEPYQMLGEIGLDLVEALEVDVLPLHAPSTLFGFPRTGWKPWKLFDGTPVLVPAAFTTEVDTKGEVFLYPEGDTTVPPSGRMPAGGYYFDALVRQEPIDESRLDPRDNTEEFTPVSEDDLGYFRVEADRLSRETSKALVAGFCYTSFGDIGVVPAQWLKRPKGIRDIEEWYVSTLTRKDYIREVFERQCELGIANLERIHAAIGDKVLATLVTAADFGTQSSLFLSPQSYRELYQPFHRRVNDWIHAHSGWKTFIHSCGSVVELVPDFIDAGFDILNPVQLAARGMEPELLKREFGNHIVFWGGGIDTQRTLPFGSPDQVRSELRKCIETFGKGGGFVFAAVHNIQANIPVENLLALFEGFREYRDLR